MDYNMYASVPADSIVAGDHVIFMNGDRLVVLKATRNLLGEVTLFLFSEATKTRVVTITSTDTIFCKLRKAKGELNGSEPHAKGYVDDRDTSFA